MTGLITCVIAPIVGCAELYRSRFLPSYFPNAARTFELALPGPIQTLAKLDSWINMSLKAIAIVIPYDVDGRKVSAQALKKKLERLDELWNNDQAKKMLCTDNNKARSLSFGIMTNLLGETGELLKAVPEIANATFVEPAWGQLKPIYEFLHRLYKEAPRGCQLYRALRTTEYLKTHLRLLGSPDHNERQIVGGILLAVIQENSLNNLTAIHTILTGIRKIIKHAPDSAVDLHVRGMDQALSLFLAIYLPALSSGKTHLFEDILDKDVLSILSSKVYLHYNKRLDGVIWTLFRTAREHNPLHWESFSRKIIKYGFHSPASAGLLIELFSEDLFAPRSHKKFLEALILYIRRSELPLQIEGLRGICDPRFGRGTRRGWLINALVPPIFNWILAEDITNAPLNSALHDAASYWLTDPLVQELCVQSSEFATTCKCVQNKFEPIDTLIEHTQSIAIKA